MSRWRKKPVVIEAFQMTPGRRFDNRDWPEWLNEAWQRDPGEPGAVFSNSLQAPMAIRTVEGVMEVGWGDWIIRGVRGELYPCKPDIFEATYEKVGGTNHIKDEVRQFGGVKPVADLAFLRGQVEEIFKWITKANDYHAKIDRLEWAMRSHANEGLFAHRCPGEVLLADKIAVALGNQEGSR